MKKLFTLALFATTALFAGCKSTEPAAPEMDTPESIGRVKETVEKNIDTTQYKIITISWSETEELSNEPALLNVEMVGTDGLSYRQSFSVGDNNQEPMGEPEPVRRAKTFDFATVPHLAADDINPEVIMAQLETAKAMIDTEAYDIQSVGQYELKTDPRNGKCRTNFVLRTTDKHGATTREGRNIVTTYYEVRFDVDGDGNVKMREE